ncbi:MAG: hypothetical protein ACPG6V_05240 [Flavobacteriales bacterium]
MSRVIKNNKAYDSGDVDTFINGVPIDVNEITYGTEQEHQVNHSLANDATSWSKGKITHTGSITLMMQDVVPLEKAAKGSLLNLKPFDINVSFINEYNVPVNDTLTVKFKNQGRDVTGDMGLNKQYELFVLGIDYNN